jgi:hypothetical protein
MAAQPTTRAPLTPRTSRSGRSTADLVVLSHLRWTWVWQRPQHLVSRFARLRAEDGARTWFVEEPVLGDVNAPRLETADVGSGITQVWLVLPKGTPHRGHLGFDAAPGYAALLTELLSRRGVVAPEVLLYTPMALDIAEALSPSRLFYDVMDDLPRSRRPPTAWCCGTAGCSPRPTSSWPAVARSTRAWSSTPAAPACSPRAASRPRTSPRPGAYAPRTSARWPATWA